MRGVRLIDGIGEECHGYESLSISGLKSNFDLLSSAGIPIYITEYDVRGTDETQLAVFGEQFTVLFELPYVKGFTIRGYVQGQTWRENSWLLSTAGAERPTLQWLVSYFGSPTPRPSGTRGDANGDGAITIIDALVAAQYYVGLQVTSFDPENADANCDGAVTIVDALLIARYYVGLLTGFC